VKDARRQFSEVDAGDEQIQDQAWRVYAVSDITGRVQVQVGKSRRQLALGLKQWVKSSLVSAGLLFLIMGGAIWLVIGWSLRLVTAVQIAIRERFYCVPGNGARGNGIGLSMVAQIAQLHGATIEVGEGLGGRGFGVTVRFPPPVPVSGRTQPPREISPRPAFTVRDQDAT
jgi:hypothetical protein